MSKTYKSILITGASGGIGRALAMTYAAPGVSLALIGRRRGALEETAGHCRNKGAETLIACLDVTDTATLSNWIAEHDRKRPLDLVIANAGITSTISAEHDAESWEDIRKVFDTNVYGALATVHPAMEAMRARGRGQIALMSSLGGFIGMPVSPAYNASKAAIKIYGEGLRGWLEPQGVGVTVICPGFVKSALSDLYPCHRPFMLTSEKAAAIIEKGLAQNRARITFPFPLNLAVWLLSILPPAWSLFLQKFSRFV